MADMTTSYSTLHSGTFDAPSVTSPVDYCVLMPSDASRDERLPLILHLHGAMSSAEQSLRTAAPVYDAAWRRGALPRAVVACATTPTRGGFYIDHPGGDRWEALVGADFPEAIAQRFRIGEARAVIGSSMGGYGALKLAFRAPERYVAVAAIAPAVFPGESIAAVPSRNLPSVLGELHEAMGKDDAAYRRNSVYGIARDHRDRIVTARMGIYFDCGDADEFGLHDGAVFLDRLLSECAIPHEFHSVPGAGHADAAAARLARALDFLGHRLAVR